MKKTFLLLLITFLSYNLIAQITKGTSIFDVYIGYSHFDANPGRTLFEDIEFKTKNRVFSQLPPFGARYAYLLNDKISLGMEMSYRSTQFNFDNDTGIVDYHYQYSITKFRIMARLAYYMINKEHISLYYGLAAGYKYVDKKWETNDSSFIGYDPYITFPIAFRASIGCRYYITKNIAFNIEAGLFGGSFVNGGLSLLF